MAYLPSYEILVRWTVADTTKWLSENGLGEYKDSFKKEGVDGSKLAKLNDTDIDNLKSAPTKKKIILKNAVAGIDRSRVNSLPKTQGMMNKFRSFEPASDPSPPPRPPRARQPLPHELEPPASHAPAPPQLVTNEFEDDNEDAYSWGDDFNYQSDPEGDDEDYINEKEWPQHDHNSNNIDARNDFDDEEFYEQPTNSPSQSFTEGGIVAQLQRELSQRTSVKGTRPTRRQVAHTSEDEDDEDYETPLADPRGQEVPPARPPRPGQRSQASPRKMEPQPVERAPPRPSALSRPPPPIPIEDDEQVYDEPDEDRERAERVRQKAKQKKVVPSRQLPPVPSPSHEERALPTPPRSGSKPPIPKIQPQEPEETYEPMDAPQRTMPSPDPPRPSRTKPQPAQRSSRPLPNVPSPTDTTTKKGRNAAVPPPVQRDALDIYDWYHKSIDRSSAESFLREQREDGMYLIRKSKRGGTEQQYTLTIYKQERVYNLPIRKRERDGKYALGAEKPNELNFESVPKLVEYFKTKLIMLNPKARNASGSTRLMVPMPK